MELLKSIVGSVTRNALGPVIAYLVAKGWLVADSGEQLVTVIITTAAAVLWGAWVKYKDRILRLVALRMPAGSTEDQLKAEAKDIKTIKDLKALPMLLILIPALMATGCPSDAAKKTEKAIRDIYIGLQGASESVEILNKDKKLSDAAALKAYSSLNQIGVGTKQFKEAVRAYGEITPENKRDLIEKIDLIIAQIDKARQNDLIGISADDVKSIELNYELAKSGYITLKGVIQRIKKPTKVDKIPALIAQAPISFPQTRLALAQ